MNVKTNTIAPNKSEEGRFDAVFDTQRALHRAQATLTTVWMALQSPSLGDCEEDFSALSSVILDASVLLREADKSLGSVKW